MGQFGNDIAALWRSGTAAGVEDARLLRRFEAGEPDASADAFAAIVARHGGLVLRLCREILRDPHRAEDAAQGVFLVLARKAHTIRDGDCLASWLHGVSLRVARRMRADDLARRERESKAAALRPDPPLNDPLLAAEARASLHEELARLPETYRRPLIRCYLEGMSRSEAADRLGCPPRTIDTRLTRGRDRLRDRLVRRGLAPAVAAFASWNTPAVRASAPSSSWIESTSRLALEFARGQSLSCPSADLAKGVLAAMLGQTIRASALAVSLAGCLALGLIPFLPGPSSTIAAKPATGAKPSSVTDDTPSRAAQIVILDADTGQPIPGALIRSSMDFGQYVSYQTNEKGEHLLDLSGQRLSNTFFADVWADGYVQQRLTDDDRRRAEKSSGTTRVEFRLHKGNQTLGGIIRDEDGRPIAGAEVAIWGYLGEMKDPKELAYLILARTDDQGQWRSSSFRDMKFVYLYLDHPDFVSDNAVGRIRAFGQPGEQVDPAVLKPLVDFSDVQVMKRGVALSGRVTDDAGIPIPNADVAWLPLSLLPQMSDSDLAWRRTGGDGRFNFPHVEPGDLRIVARAPGRAPEMVARSVTAGMNDVDLRLPPAVPFAGRVVDGEGRPIAGAGVYVANWKGFGALGVHLATDSEGRFRWDSAPNDPVRVSVRADDRLSIVFQEVTPEPNFVFTLHKALSISGSLRDAETRKRIDQAEVEVGIVDDAGQVTWVPTPHLPGDINIAVWASGGEWHADLDADLPKTYQFRFSSPGYAPYTTRPIRTEEGKLAIDIVLEQRMGPGPSGLVLGPDGQPLPGATIALAGPFEDRLTIKDGRMEARTPQGQEPIPPTTSGADGQFTLPASAYPQKPEYSVVAVHDLGYGEVSREAFEADPTVRLRPWGRVEGRALLAGKPMADREIQYRTDRYRPSDIPEVFDYAQVRTDADGRFAFDRVAPGSIRVVPVWPREGDEFGSDRGVLVVVEPGQTARAEYGAEGRPVIARIVPPEGFEPLADYLANSRFEVVDARPMIPYPPELAGADRARTGEWITRWWDSEDGRAYRRSWFTRYRIKVRPDGTIRAEDIPAGQYRLTLYFTPFASRGPDTDLSRIARATVRFVVPEIPGGRSDEPLDLGEIHPRPRVDLRVGDEAPAFSVPTLDGGQVSLAEDRGKFALVHFWATWNPASIDELRSLQAARDRFHDDDRLVIISLNVDANQDSPRHLLSNRGLDWPQGFLAEATDDPIYQSYGVERLPAVFLIGPDGKIVARDLRGSAIPEAIAGALGPRP